MIKKQTKKKQFKRDLKHWGDCGKSSLCFKGASWENNHRQIR